MSNGLIAFMFAAGLAGWVYSKIHRQTGGNTQSALTVAAAAGLIGFIFFFTLLRMLISN